MKGGALGVWWYDNNPRTSLAEKVQAASYRYERRTGRPATVCWVNPEQSKEPLPEKVNGIEVLTSQHVHLHYYYAGEREDK